MKMIAINWTSKVNMIRVKCEHDDGTCVYFDAPMNRWKVKCPWCNKVENIENLRNNFVERGAINEDS